jgi:hypothetical protein
MWIYKGKLRVKKKIIGITVAASLLITGVVSATSMWGTYKGNDIIRITSNGAPLKSADVPAISYNGRTMIPINMLGQVGLQYSWDQKNKTVDVNSNNSTIINGNEFVSESEFIELNKVMQSHRAFIYFMDQIELTSLCITMMNNSVSNADYSKTMEQVNRINISGLKNWSDLLTAMGSGRASTFTQIKDNVEEAKTYLLSKNSSNAYTNMLSAKVSMNTLYTLIDKDVSSTFTIKNMQK